MVNKHSKKGDASKAGERSYKSSVLTTERISFAQ